MTSLEVYKNLTYTVVGRTEIGGRQFAVVPVEQPFSVLIDDGGIVQSTALNGKTIMAWSFTVEPPAGQFIWESQEQVFEEGGFENFEIVFSGQDPDALHFLYREYSPDNLARPAYTQELTYPLGSETIQFRKLAIRVLRAEGSQISFVVESD